MPKREFNLVKKEYKCAGCGYGGCAGGIYGLGFIGAAIYYIQQATGFWSGGSWSIEGNCLACILSLQFAGIVSYFERQ